MMFQWGPDRIRFMRDASEYGDYHQRLAELMSPWLHKETHICDAGCGLGYLSLALAPYVKQVTAVDKNADALQVLEENCRRRGIHNVIVRCGNLALMQPKELYDSMAFCLFGHIGEILAIAKRQCRGKVFVITKNDAAHRFSVGSYALEGNHYQTACRYLRERGIPFESRTLKLELGQPFRNREDARRFFQLYSRDEDKSAITDNFLRKKLVETENDSFPYYLPHARKLGFIQLDAGNIPTIP